MSAMYEEGFGPYNGQITNSTTQLQKASGLLDSFAEAYNHPQLMSWNIIKHHLKAPHFSAQCDEGLHLPPSQRPRLSLAAMVLLAEQQIMKGPRQYSRRHNGSLCL